MPKRTKAWDAQDALLALLQAQTWPDNIRPALGTPARMDGDAVWVSGEVDDWNAEYRVSGLAQKDETFVPRVHCLVTRLGTFVELRDRLESLGALVEDAIGQSYSLSGTVMLATIKQQQVEETMLDDGRRRQGLLTFFIECEAFVAG